jgi:hypothetical protein
VPAAARAFGSAEEAECARVRASLVKTITGDSAFAVARRRGAGYVEPQAVPVDYALFRQRYQAMQQSMETGVGNLRGRLRALLAAKTPAMSRLALLDAVMERALGERERNLLASVPVLLAGHFERLREAAQQAQGQELEPAADDGTQAESAGNAAAAAAAGSAADGSVEPKAHVQAQPQPQAPALDAAPRPAHAVAPNAWLDVFRKDMQSVLLAELDVRLQPVEGLLAALRTR